MSAFAISRFTYALESDEKLAAKDAVLVYNSFADSLMQIPADLYQALLAGDVAALQGYEDEIGLLKDQGFLVDSQEGEYQELRAWYNTYIKQKSELALTILLSYRCNFGCAYCFESKVLTGLQMSEPIKQDIVQWTKN